MNERKMKGKDANYTMETLQKLMRMYGKIHLTKGDYLTLGCTTSRPDLGLWGRRLKYSSSRGSGFPKERKTAVSLIKTNLPNGSFISIHYIEMFEHILC